jgi:hypothetical protein
MIDEIAAMETLEKRFKRFKEKNKKIFRQAKILSRIVGRVR